MKTFKKLIDEKDYILGLYVILTEPGIIELACRAGFDFVRIDFEHGMFSYAELKEQIRVANLMDMPCQVRISDMTDITKLLDFGVTGIVVPDTNFIQRAKDAVHAAKYYPLGARGMFNIGHFLDVSGYETFADYLKDANDIVTVTIQIEDAKAEPLLDEFASMPGIDMLASGKLDISQSLGIPGKGTDPKVLEFERKIVKAALAHKKQVSVMLNGKKHMEDLLAQGVKVFLTGSDDILIRKAFSDCVKEYKG